MAAPIAFHVIFRLRDGRVICPDTRSRRRAARSFLERDPAFELLTFRCADTHLHGLVVRHPGEFARRVEISIQHALRPKVGFSPAHIVPVETQRHLANAFDYILGQEEHHGITSDPLHDGSNLPDLLGLRWVGKHTVQHVRTYLPRVDRPALLRHLPAGALDDEHELDLQHLPHLVDAAAAAAALPNLRGRTGEAAVARSGAATLARRLGPTGLVARALRISPRSVRRSLGTRPPQHVLSAILGQARLRATSGDPTPVVARSA